MSTNVATQRLMDDGESDRVEFVKTADSLQRIAQTVCAFLNTSGGTIVVGLDDNASASGSIEMQQAESIRDYLRRVVTSRWERRASLGLELDGLATELLEETIRLATDRRGYRFRDSARTAVLEELGLLQFGRLTNATDVAFGEKVFLRHPQTRLRAVCYESDRGENFLDEQLYEGPAFRLVDDVLAFLKRHIAIAAEFVPGKAQRRADRQNAGNGAARIDPDQPGHQPYLLSPRAHGTCWSRHVQDGP